MSLAAGLLGAWRLGWSLQLLEKPLDLLQLIVVATDKNNKCIRLRGVDLLCLYACHSTLPAPSRLWLIRFGLTEVSLFIVIRAGTHLA